jgi:hypothetical protein
MEHESQQDDGDTGSEETLSECVGSIHIDLLEDGSSVYEIDVGNEQASQMLAALCEISMEIVRGMR